MPSINTNVTAMAAIRSLTMITSNMADTQSRIESTLKINKANDDPAVFSIAQTMRADLKGLEAVSGGLNFGTSALTVARDAATKISTELGTLKKTITQGQQQGLDKDSMNEQVTNILENMKSFAQTATFNNVNLLDNSDDNEGDKTLAVLRDTSGTTIDIDNQSVISSAGLFLNLDNLDVDTGGINISFDETIDPAAADFIRVRIDTGETETLSDGTDRRIFEEVIFEFVDPGTATAQLDGLTDDATNLAQVNTRVIAVELQDDLGGDLTPAAELGRLVTAMKAEGLGVRINTDGTIDLYGGSLYEIETSVAAGGSATITRDADADFGDGDTQENTTTGATDALWTVSAAGEAETLSVIGGTPDVDDLATALTFTGGSTAIETVDEAISQINVIVSTIGARLAQVKGQSEFITQLSDSIKEGLGSLVDADMAEESAKLSSLQTKQQLAIQSLSIANQQGQALLGLFRG